MFLLVKTLNQNRPVALCLDQTQLERQFNRCWTEFWNPYLELCEKHARAKAPHPTDKISNEDILAEMRGAIRQIADALTEIRRSQSVVVSAEQPTDLQQFTVQCPFCQKGNEVLMPDRPGETKPTICSVCGSRFNVHMTGTHSVFVRPISAAPTIGVLTRMGGISSTSYEVLSRVGGGLVENWRRFLIETHAWVEPMTLTNLVSMTATASIENGAGTELTADSLCKKIFLRMDATPSPRLSRSMVRAFIKIILSGGAFNWRVKRSRQAIKVSVCASIEPSGWPVLSTGRLNA